MCHIEIRRCTDDAGQTGRKIQRIPHFLRSRRSLWIRDEFRHVRIRRASQKGTKHKSRIINLQGKHEPAYISGRSFAVYVKLVVRKYLHTSFEIIRRTWARTKNKLLRNIKSLFSFIYVKFEQPLKKFSLIIKYILIIQLILSYGTIILSPFIKSRETLPKVDSCQISLEKFLNCQWYQNKKKNILHIHIFVF